MKVLYYLLSGIILFILRQSVIPFWGSWADLFLIVPPVFIWLWQEDDRVWGLLLSASLLVDIILVRTWPFHLFASLSALIFYYGLVSPYLSHNTTLTRLVTIIIWIASWRILYLGGLALAWLGGGIPIDITNQFLWPTVGWFVIGLTLAGVGILIQSLIGHLKSKFSR